MDKRTKSVSTAVIFVCGITFIAVFIKLASEQKISTYAALIAGAAVLVGDSIAAYVIFTKPDKYDNP